MKLYVLKDELDHLEGKILQKKISDFLVKKVRSESVSDLTKKFCFRLDPDSNPRLSQTFRFTKAFSLFQAFHLLLPGAGGHSPLQKWINRWILPFSTFVTTMSLSPFFFFWSSSSYSVNRLMIGPLFSSCFFLKVFSWKFRRKNTKEPELLCKMLPLLLTWLVRSHFVPFPANCLDF